MDTEIIYYNSPVGWLQLQASGNELQSLLFCETEKHKAILPGEKITQPVSPVLKETVKQLNAYFKGELIHFSIRLSPSGTVFQQTVWKALQQIPFGRTVSYLDLSKNISNPKAIRAVGTANGSNPIAIIIPCHRVIGSSGEMVGYGGDLWRKKWLLAHENKYANGVQTLF